MRYEILTIGIETNTQEVAPTEIMKAPRTEILSRNEIILDNMNVEGGQETLNRIDGIVSRFKTAILLALSSDPQRRSVILADLEAFTNALENVMDNGFQEQIMVAQAENILSKATDELTAHLSPQEKINDASHQSEVSVSKAA